MSPIQSTLSRPAYRSSLAEAVARFCLEGHRPPGPEVRERLSSSPKWKALADAGSALWLDTGDVDGIGKVWTRELSALTTNNTLLNKEVQKGVYDEVVSRAVRTIREVDPGAGADLLVGEIAFILNAIHGLKLVRTFDADVSVELHTDISRDAEASYQYGKRFHAICPERFIVKVPLTPEGVLAARRLVLDGIRVNFTLGFSARQNRLLGQVVRPDYVNVFLGRLNSFVADSGLGSGANVGEKATLASQRMLMDLNEAQGTWIQQIAASIRGGKQCLSLAGVDVLTIPLGAADEYLALDLPPGAVGDRTDDDPEVVLRSGLDLEEEGIAVLWEIDDALVEALSLLCREDLDSMTGPQLRAFLADHGVRDFFPALTEADRARLASDGKIPIHAHWQERVRAGELAWDALLSEAALASFTADQKQLDDRIRRLL